MTKKRISVMIVDDNDMMRTLLRGILRGEMYEICGEARNGAAAVEMAERIKPDIICMDILMPEKDGLEALAEIKATQPQVEVVMITSSASAEAVQESIQNGASGFIVKPFNAAKILDTLERITAQQKHKN